MNIAFIVYSHYSRDARVRKYCEALSRLGHKIDVICLHEVYIPKEKNIKLTRIATGVPMGGDLKYVDKMSISKSLEFRRGM